MSTLTFNPFDLLDENGGDRRRAPKPAAPKPVAKPADAPKQQASQPKSAPAKNATGAGASAAGGKRENESKARPQGDAQRPKGQNQSQQGQSQGQGAGREGGAKRSPAQPRQQQQQGAPVAGNDGEVAERPRERRDRDHRSHERNPNQRGRQFDRRSGTGRPANENKRAGSGKGNWGTIEEGQETEVPKDAEGEKEETTPAPATAEGEAVPTEPPKSPEKEYLSLDEYLATKKNKPVSGVEAPKLRAAGEGVDQSAWANYAPLAKDGEEAPQKKKKDAVKKDAVNGKDDKLADILQFTLPPHETFDRPDRRGRGKGPGPFNKGGRGGSGGGRQGGPRPGGRGKQTGAAANVALEDQTQFPSLGGSPAASPAQSAPAAVKA